MANQPPLRRELGLVDGVAVTLGIIIGAGIFSLPGRVAQYAPTFIHTVPWWIAAALISLLGAMVFAELGARLPNTGGEYVYLREAFGPLAAFLYGWSLLAVIRTNPGATLALAFAEYFSTLVPLPRNGTLVVAVLLLWTIAGVNYFGLRAGKPVQSITSFAKVGGIVLVIVAGVAAGIDPGKLTSSHAPVLAGTLENFTSAMLLIGFTFTGFERLGNVAGEMRRPVRDIPRALVFSVLLVACLYVGLVAAIHGSIPIGQLSGTRTPVADAARLWLGRYGQPVIALVVMLSTSSSINATVLTTSRVYYTMACDGLLFSSLTRVHPRWHAPHVAIMVHCAWASVLVLLYRNLESLIGSQVFAITLWLSAMAIGLWRLRRRTASPGFRIPWFGLLCPVLLGGLLFLAGATILTKPLTAFANVGLILLGVPVFLWRRRHYRRSSSA